MPGFHINTGAGGAYDGTGPSNTSEFLWQHRWIIENLGKRINKSNKGGSVVAKEVALPDLKMERQEVLGGLVWYKFAKAVKFDDAVVTFYDDSNISDRIELWKRQVYTEEDGIRQHTTYKQDSAFSLLGGDGKVIKKITLKNSWPVNISQGRLTYTESDFKLIVVTLAFDWAEIRIEGSL